MKANFIEVSLNEGKNIYIKDVNEPYLSSSLHFHNLCELVLIEESFGKRIVGDHIQDFKAGDLVLLGPKLPHIWYNDPIFYTQQDSVRAKATVIYFSQDFIIQLMNDSASVAVVKKFMDRSTRGIWFNSNKHLNVISKIVALKKNTGLTQVANFLLIIEALINSTDFEYLSSPGYSVALNQNDTKRVHDIYIYAIENFKKEIFLKDVAEIANLTPSAFCRFFKKHTGKSLSRFINEIRIAHACKLLHNSELSITTICYESGFQNPTNFNKFFYKISGCSPSEYRRKIS